ncbi:hypothetical protein ABKN59_009707 [Abortiporus biennis]
MVRFRFRVGNDLKRMAFFSFYLVPRSNNHTCSPPRLFAFPTSPRCLGHHPGLFINPALQVLSTVSVSGQQPPALGEITVPVLFFTLPTTSSTFASHRSSCVSDIESPSSIAPPT